MSLPSKSKADFSKSADYWQLEKLYIDLAGAKGKSLTPLEKTFLQGLLCGYSPREIANYLYNSGNSSSVRVSLSNGLYKYIQQLLSENTGELVKIGNWSRVATLLDHAGYKKQLLLAPDLKISSDHGNSTNNRSYWEEQCTISHFWGRTGELALLEQWLVQDRCRVVSIFGMIGLGKTALAVKLVERVEEEFDYVIWRSLHSLPEINPFLGEIITFLAQNRPIKIPETFGAKISLLMFLLRSQRCLLILNQFQAILQPGAKAGTYRQGYELYGELLRHLSKEYHQSCCLITSREQPQELSVITSNNLTVRSLHLNGLSSEHTQKLLVQQGIIGMESERKYFVRLYDKNPLLIQTAILTVKNFFNSNLSEFLATKNIFLGDIRQILDQEWQKLSPSEQKVMQNLAINQKLLNLRGMSPEFATNINLAEQIEALASLQRRGLIQKNGHGFHQKMFWQSYILEQLIERIYTNLNDSELADIAKYLLGETLLSRESSPLNLSNHEPNQQLFTRNQYLSHRYDGSR